MNGDLVSHFAFDGKVAVIFGGAKGIGRAVALEWARRGAHVAIADIDLNAARDAAEEIVGNGGKAHGFEANVMSDSSVADALEGALKSLGEIDILMTNVGAMLNGNPEDIPFAEWNRIMDLNYLGAVRGITQVLPKMLERGSGHIVTTASFAGLYPYAASRIPYAASKAAIIALTQNLALYTQPFGVRASCLIPGPVATNIMDSMTSWSANCQMRSPGLGLTVRTPEEVAITLCESMARGAILIPTDDRAWEIVQDWAKSPDEFVLGKISEFQEAQL